MIPIPNKFLIYGLVFVSVVAGIYFTVRAYNAALKETAIQEARAEAAETAVKTLQNEKLALETALSTRQVKIDELNRQKDINYAQWQNVLRQLRQEGDKCIDAPLPTPIFERLQKPANPDGS